MCPRYTLKYALAENLVTTCFQYATYRSRHKANTMLAQCHVTSSSTDHCCHQHHHWNWYLTRHHPIVALICWEETVYTLSKRQHPLLKQRSRITEMILAFLYGLIHNTSAHLESGLAWKDISLHLAGIQHSHSATSEKYSCSLTAVSGQNWQLQLLNQWTRRWSVWSQRSNL